jgi:hypothetical protein
MTITAAVTTAVGLVLPLVDRVPEDKDVKAGWLAFAVFIALALAVVFLGFSLTKHLRRAEQNLGTKHDETAESPEQTKP